MQDLGKLALCLLPLLAPAGCEKQTTGSPSSLKPQASVQESPAGDSTNPADSAPPRPTSAPAPVQGVAPSNLAGPRWWSDQTVNDFGEVWAGTVVQHAFGIKNVGMETLKILEAKAQCSCTASDEYTREIPPGQTGTMPIHVDTRGKRGFVNEKMTIKTNDAVKPDITFEFRGIVKALVETDLLADLEASRSPKPEEALAELKKRGVANFGSIKADQRLQRTIKLRNTSGQPLTMKFKGVLPRGSRFTAEFNEAVPQEEYIVTIKGEPPFPIGVTSASVVIETNVPGMPTYNLGPSAYVPPRVEFVPRRIVVDPKFTFVPLRKISLNNNGDTAWDIKAISVSDPAIQIRVLPAVGNPKNKIVEVSLPAGGYVCPPHGEVIRIETTDSEVPAIEIPVVASRDLGPTPRPPDQPLTMHPVNLGTKP